MSTTCDNVTTLHQIETQLLPKDLGLLTHPAHCRSIRCGRMSIAKRLQRRSLLKDALLPECGTAAIRLPSVRPHSTCKGALPPRIEKQAAQLIGMAPTCLCISPRGPRRQATGAAVVVRVRRAASRI